MLSNLGLLGVDSVLNVLDGIAAVVACGEILLRHAFVGYVAAHPSREGDSCARVHSDTGEVTAVLELIPAIGPPTDVLGDVPVLHRHDEGALSPLTVHQHVEDEVAHSRSS